MIDIQTGWKLVPTEATPEMIAACANAAREYMELFGGNSPTVMYKAMLAAAPAQDAPTDTRAAFEQAMRRLSNGEPDWDSPAALWAYAAWNARGIFDAKGGQAAPE